MADNTTINPGSTGDSIATDDIGGVKFQRVKLIHGADGVNSGDVATTNPFPVALSNLEKAEDAGHSSGHSGVMALAVRKDTVAALAGTDLDYIPLITDANGRLWVSALIDTALPAGTAAIGKLAANSGVDIGDVDVTSVTPGTAASSLGKAEDGGHTTGDVGVMALAVRTDSPANRSGTDGDYEPLQMSAGRLWTAAKELRPTTGTHSNVNDTASSTTILASNAARLGATFFNDSTTTLYLKCGATASTTSFTTQLAPGGYYELPQPAYTGIVDGIWSADASGAVRVTEFT